MDIRIFVSVLAKVIEIKEYIIVKNFKYDKAEGDKKKFKSSFSIFLGN